MAAPTRVIITITNPGILPPLGDKPGGVDPKAGESPKGNHKRKIKGRILTFLRSFNF